MKILIKSAVSESQLEADPKTTGRDLFALMSKTFGVAESWFFGLMYKGPDNEDVWIDLSKKAMKQIRASTLYYKIKFYPEDTELELIEEITIEYFFKEIRREILTENIYCPADTSVLLASYALQAKYGDADSHEDLEKLLAKDKLLPEKVQKKYKMGQTEWLQNICNMWKKHSGLDKAEAMTEYLKLAQNLEMFGNTYFDITNKKGTKLIVGVNCLGLDIYKPENKLTPQISFPWSEIKKLHFKDRKFMIQPNDRKAKDFVFLTADGKISKCILALGVGNHAMYVRRRKPDSPEITKMKEKAAQLRQERRVQKQKFVGEKKAREEAEKRERAYKEQLEEVKREMERKHQSLLEAQMTIQKLKEQLEELQRSKQELEDQRRELQEMMERLEQSKNMEAAERQKLEDEIRAKHEEVTRIQEEVQLKDEETRRLQEEVEAAQRREEEARRLQLEEAAKREEEMRRREMEEAARREELESVPKGADVSLPQVTEVNENLKEQLKMLQDQLEQSRKKESETELDEIHRINLRDGRDKFKTLADIRRGNTVRRVEMFENM